MEHFTLDNTGIRVGYPKALTIRLNGDDRADGVSPGVRVDSLDKALGWIARQQGKTEIR